MKEKTKWVLCLLFLIILMTNGYYQNSKIKYKKLQEPDIYIDNTTGLVWQNQIYKDKKRNKKLNWKEAQSYCESLQIKDLIDWSLPSLSELESSYKIKRYFKDDPGLFFWTSSNVLNDNNRAYSIDFNGGIVWKTRKDKICYVRCVHH